MELIKSILAYVEIQIVLILLGSWYRGMELLSADEEHATSILCRHASQKISLTKIILESLIKVSDKKCCSLQITHPNKSQPVILFLQPTIQTKKYSTS